MNNNTTQHDTTRHYMGTHSLGHHVWVAGNQYVQNAKEALEAGQTWLAETFLLQAEKALEWANALQAGVIGESLDDLLGVDVPAQDAWVRTSEIARAWAMVHGEVLPEPPSHVDVAGHSPENVSRETLQAHPLDPAPLTYSEGMETTQQASDLVAQFISLIAKQVVAEVTETVQGLIEDALSEHSVDVEEVTEDWQFTSAVESIISDYDLSDKVRDAVADLSFSVTVD